MTNSLLHGCVRIYYGYVQDYSVDALMNFLSDHEKVRASRIQQKGSRDLYVVAHAHLRVLLGAFLNVDIDEIKQDFGIHGKPYVNGSDLQFNISHTREAFAFALGRDVEIGVDVEHIERSAEVDNLSKFIFSDEDLAKFKTSGEHRRHEHFINAWTRKEAVLKARGSGFTSPIKKVSVSFLCDEQADIVALPWTDAESTKWHLQSFDLPNGYRGALAVCGELRSMELIRLSPGQHESTSSAIVSQTQSVRSVAPFELLTAI